uniref:Polyketide synthase-like phosphopantetheine-binding domain-containing protein n=1 Tax=Schizophyllum commune (strain H4-8 / FGSC 9210) TaxID=578458 RepID=D8QBK6_SCHCM
MPTQEEDWKEWCWVELDANASLDWEKQDDGTEELIIPDDHWHKPAVLNMTGRRAYATNDLYLPHPTKPHLRKVVGRKDDVIVHSTGEKTVPVPIEGMILTSPLVAAAVMFGRGKDEAGILIEPSAGHKIDVKDNVQVAAFRNSVWLIVEEANKVAPAYSRIFKELILVAHPDRPLPRTDKGTVVRKLALKVYEEEIENMWVNDSNANPPSSWDAPTIADWIARHVRNITGRDMDRHVDLFEQGFDSLNSTILRRRLISALKSDPSTVFAATEIRQNVVYEHPSIKKLATIVSKLARGETGYIVSSEASAKEAVVRMAAKHSEGLPGYVDASTLPKYVPADVAEAPLLPTVVLMTGTTGNLGADILTQLLQDERVSRVYTIERVGSAPAAHRQRTRFEDKGLDIGLLESQKLLSLEGDVCAVNFGQSDAVYAEMLNTVNMIFHVAWRLDFNLNISAFEHSVRSTRALVDFARYSVYAGNLRFIFTNSIGSAWSWDSATQGPVPEQLIEDPGVAVGGGGYGQAKYAAERVLAASGIRFCSVRVGQISGDAPRGSWATTDWFPILVKTSVALGVLPSDEQVRLVLLRTHRVLIVLRRLHGCRPLLSQPLSSTLLSSKMGWPRRTILSIRDPCNGIESSRTCNAR